MPDFEINLYLSNGGKATLKLENVNQTAVVLEQTIESQMRQPGDAFRLTGPTVVVSLKKNEIIGYSIDQS
jgi:hypothetical protein